MMASENPWTEFTISETSPASSGSSVGDICGACLTGCLIESGSMPPMAGTDAYRAFMGLGQRVWGKPTARHGVRPVLWHPSGAAPTGQREIHTLDRIKQTWPAHVVAYDPQDQYHYRAHLTGEHFASGSWDPTYLGVDPSGSMFNVETTIPGGSEFTSKVVDLGWYWNQYFWYFDWLDRKRYNASGSFYVRWGTGATPDSTWTGWTARMFDRLLPPSGSTEVARFNQWKVRVHASQSFDYRLFQVSYKALTQAEYDTLPTNYGESNRKSQPYMSGSALLDCGF